MDSGSTYYRQVQLLIRLLPIVATESCFALKGGTAINLFYRDLPRLSVDIDLVYLPREDRETTLRNVRAALTRIADGIERQITGSKVFRAFEGTESLRILVSNGDVQVKIELNPVLRGSVFPPRAMAVRDAVQTAFGFAEIAVLTLPDLYAGKLCAALDRQHPRDLFDVKLLLENEGISDDLRRAFLVYLISHNRWMSELLAPNRIDISGPFANEFQYMSTSPVTLDDLNQTREQLIHTINDSLTEAERRFLISFKKGNPQWELLGIEGVSELPAVRWKLINLQKMQPELHEKAIEKLRAQLGMPQQQSPSN